MPLRLRKSWDGWQWNDGGNGKVWWKIQTTLYCSSYKHPYHKRRSSICSQTHIKPNVQVQHIYNPPYCFAGSVCVHQFNGLRNVGTFTKLCSLWSAIGMILLHFKKPFGTLISLTKIKQNIGVLRYLLLGLRGTVVVVIAW